MPNTVPRRPIRWWPLGIILALGIGIVGVVQSNDSMPFQRRNLISIPIGMGTFLLTWIWWGFFSRAAGKLRVISSLLLILAGIACFSLFRVVGVTGDLVPVFVFRWRSTPAPVAAAKGLEQRKASPDGEEPRDSYAQFLGPNRDGRLPGPLLATNWNDVPPRVIWRRPVGTGWAGFAVAGRRAVTLEQDGPAEVIGCYDADTGEPLWRQAYEARYSTPIGGEGPRTTPTIVSNRVYTFGATGWLKCLDLASGSNYWSVDVPAAGGRALEWGMAGSPLVWKGLVIVPAGGSEGHSVMAFDAQSGRLAWSAGNSVSSYGSPRLMPLAGRDQILVLNSRSLASHDPAAGTLLWETNWGIGYPLVAMPIQVTDNRVLFSAGYNVGAELFEITELEGKLFPRSVWRSNRLKAKFANPVLKDGYIYGLDDGILACIDARDGALRWKGDRYGQGLLVADRLLMMSEQGNLKLVVPSPEGPGTAQSFAVFSGKTWNPIALAGNRLYARNDREAVCLELPVAPVR